MATAKLSTRKACFSMKRLTALFDWPPSAPACGVGSARAVQFRRRRSELWLSLHLSCARSSSRHRASTRRDPDETGRYRNLRSSMRSWAFSFTLAKPFSRDDAETTMIEASRSGKIRKVLMPLSASGEICLLRNSSQLTSNSDTGRCALLWSGAPRENLQNAWKSSASC